MLLQAVCASVRSQVSHVSKRFWHKPMKLTHYFGIRITDGMRAHRGDIIVSQRELDYYPGLNVEINAVKQLKALCDGTVYITREKMNLDFSQPWVNEMESWRKDQPIYKLCFNVVPDEPVGRFKLVDQI